MPKLLFFSRVALLCNLCFLVTFLLRYAPGLKSSFFVSTIIIMGLVLGIVINTLVNILYLATTISRRPISRFVPLWLIITNILFFIFQAILLLK